jgi:CheY-like chemotaxis protein
MNATDVRTVLLADDHDASRSAQRVVLEQAGFIVAEARSGFDALALTLSARPDLVLLDLVLPGIDGQQLARMLRAETSTRHVGLLALSASIDPADRVGALEAGCDEFLAKPVSPTELVETVERILDRVVGL